MLHYVCAITCFDTIRETYVGNVKDNSTTCTVLNQDTIDDPRMIINYAVNNILKSPVANPYDEVQSSAYTLQASQTIARPISADKQINKNVFSDIAYITRNSILSLTDTNNTAWKGSTYSIEFKVSGCMSLQINEECRWTAPLACSLETATSMGAATKFPEKQELACFPIMLEWKTDILSSNVVNSSSRIREMANKFGTYNLQDYTGVGGSISTNAASVVGSFVGTTQQTIYDSKSKKVKAKVVPRVTQCKTVQMLSPIETQNLGESQLICFAVNNFTTAYASSRGYIPPVPQYSALNKVDCSAIGAYVTFSQYTPDVIPEMFTLFPPIDVNNESLDKTATAAGSGTPEETATAAAPSSSIPETGSTAAGSDIPDNTTTPIGGQPRWRAISRLQIGAKYIQGLADLGQPSLAVVYAASVFAACVQSCGAAVYRLNPDKTKGISNVFLCDSFCFVAYSRGYDISKNRTNATCDVLKDSDTVLPEFLFEQLKSIVTGNNVPYTLDYPTINIYCDTFARMFNETQATTDILTYVVDGAFADNATVSYAQVISINPEVLNNGVRDIRLCTEYAEPGGGINRNSISTSTQNVRQPAGSLTGFGCAFIVPRPNETLASALLSLATRNYTDQLLENSDRLTSSIVVSQWLLLAQNVVLSVIASFGVLSLGQLASQLDSLLYTLVYYYSRMAKRVTSVNTAILILLWTVVLSLVIITNAASVANVIITILRLRSVTKYTAYRTEEVKTNSGAILVESVQVGESSTKLWPGYIIAGFYLVALLLLVMRVLYIMYTVNWKKRVEWLHDSSYGRHKTNLIIHSI